MSVSKLIKQMKRQGADPFEPNNPDWLQDAARLLEQVRARARLRMVLHKPLSRLERLISRLCNVWAADGREVQVTRALVDFVLDALEPVHPLGAKQVTRLLSAEVRRRIVLAGQGQLRVDTQVVRGTRFAEKSDSVSRQT